MGRSGAIASTGWQNKFNSPEKIPCSVFKEIDKRVLPASKPSLIFFLIFKFNSSASFSACRSPSLREIFIHIFSASKLLRGEFQISNFKLHPSTLRTNHLLAKPFQLPDLTPDWIENVRCCASSVLKPSPTPMLNRRPCSSIHCPTKPSPNHLISCHPFTAGLRPCPLPSRAPHRWNHPWLRRRLCPSSSCNCHQRFSLSGCCPGFQAAEPLPPISCPCSHGHQRHSPSDLFLLHLLQPSSHLPTTSHITGETAEPLLMPAGKPSRLSLHSMARCTERWRWKETKRNSLFRPRF